MTCLPGHLASTLTSWDGRRSSPANFAGPDWSLTRFQESGLPPLSNSECEEVKLRESDGLWPVSHVGQDQHPPTCGYPGVQARQPCGLGDTTVKCQFISGRTRGPSVTPLHYISDLTCPWSLTRPLSPVARMICAAYALIRAVRSEGLSRKKNESKKKEWLREICIDILHFFKRQGAICSTWPATKMLTNATRKQKLNSVLPAWFKPSRMTHMAL